jgi:hypothetical protein
MSLIALCETTHANPDEQRGGFVHVDRPNLQIFSHHYKLIQQWYKNLHSYMNLQRCTPDMVQHDLALDLVRERA